MGAAAIGSLDRPGVGRLQGGHLLSHLAPRIIWSLTPIACRVPRGEPRLA